MHSGYDEVGPWASDVKDCPLGVLKRRAGSAAIDYQAVPVLKLRDKKQAASFPNTLSAWFGASCFVLQS